MAGGIGLLLCLLVAVAALGWFAIGQGARASAATQDEMTLGMSMAAIVSGVQAMRRYEKDVFLSLDQPREIARYRRLWETGRESTAKALESARALVQRDEDGKQLKRLKPSLAAYEAGFSEAMKAVERGDVKTGRRRESRWPCCSRPPT